MRALSLRQAITCETADLPRCKCRCRGVFHGRMRTGFVDPLYFQQLPDDDPHKVRAPVQLPLPPGLVLDVRYGTSLVGGTPLVG